MKTETQIAQENIKIFKRINNMFFQNTACNVIRDISKEHKTSCQRFLYNTNGITHNVIIRLREDSKQAIKLYKGG